MVNLDSGVREYLSTYGTSINSLPKIAGKYQGGCIVCADAACIWDDLERFGCRSGNSVSKWGWDFLTVNRLVEVFPGRVEHAYSNSGGVLNRFIAARRQEYLAEFPVVTTHSRDGETHWKWPWNGGGTSGLGAILPALDLGYGNIVLAGMPLSDMHHNGEPPWRTTGIANEADDGPHWKRAIDLAFKGRVKSLSGRTRDWLGEPS